MPSVTATAAFSGLRPVANALGCCVGLTYNRGIGCPALSDNSRTIAYNCGACCSVIGLAFIDRSASLSELK